MPCEHLRVKGDGRHFFVEVVSTAFNGKTRLARHRLIKDGLKSLMASDELHALSITAAQTPDEWQQRSDNVAKPAFPVITVIRTIKAIDFFRQPETHITH